MWVNAFDLDETVPFVCSIPTHLRAHTSLAHSLNIHVKWIYDAANHRILLLFHILYSVLDVVLVVRRKMMARAKYQHKNEENREQTRCGYAILRQIVCSCLTKLLIPDKFSSRLFCLCCMFFRLRNVQTAINRIFRIGWIQITLRFVMPFIRVCVFLRLVTFIPIRIISHASTLAHICV